MQNITTDIYRHLVKNIELEDLMKFHEKLGITKTRFTQLMKRPESATNRLLISLSELLGINPFILYRDYNVAKSNLTEVEVDFYKQHNSLKKQAAK